MQHVSQDKMMTRNEAHSTTFTFTARNNLEIDK